MTTRQGWNPSIRFGLCLLAILLCVPRPAARAPELAIGKRIEAQKAIERVFWSHRLWPASNPGPKPPLSAVMDDAAIEARVHNDLRLSTALASYWNRPVAQDELQAELDRMARSTHDPQMLRELFAALDDDPGLIAETLVRSSLVDRLAHQAFAHDERIHGSRYQQAIEARAACGGLPCLRSMGGEYGEATLTEADQLERWRSRDIGTLGAVEETDDAFVVSAVVSRSPHEVKVANQVWRKQSFSSWWSANAAGFPEPPSVDARGYVLPQTPLAACTNDTWSATKLDVPDARLQATAVWTGTEMIVWGGTDSGSSDVNTGGRYNPATDTWVATSTGTNCPSQRREHSAIWTGTEMIVWGGGFNNTGGRYNPTSDSWTATSTGANVPLRRYGHTAVWTGTEMIVWGGFEATFLDTGGRYNPSTNSWLATATIGAPLARYLHTAVWTGSLMIVWGGQANGATQNTGGRYNPSTNAWTPTSVSGSVPAARIWHGAVWTGSLMIVWGGNSTSSTALNTGGRYDPGTDSWTATSTSGVPVSRYQHTTVWTGSLMIVWGGTLNGGSPTTNTGGRYNPTANTWATVSTGANAPTARAKHVAVWSGTEMIVWSGQGFGTFDTGSRYNPSSDTWVAMTTGTFVPSLRYNHSGVWTGAEMIVWGGRLPSGPSQLNNGGRYVPATDTWSTTSTGAGVAAARDDHTAIWTGTEMIVWGGNGATFNSLNTGGRYNPTSDSWTATSTGVNVPAIRSGHTAVWTGTEMIVWGGYGSAGRLNTGGRYNPSANSWTATSIGANVPAGRGDHSAVWTGTEMIVWGGNDNGGAVVNTGGRYNPSTDTWLATSTGANVPSARYGPPAVWSGTEMIVWGGTNTAQAYFNTGGRYNPSTNSWLATATSGAPLGRGFNSAEWTGSEMIVWGGFFSDGNTHYLDTGGRYNPGTNSWTATSTAGKVAAARYAHSSVWTGTEMIVWSGIPLTATGGRYCACPNGGTVYRDADGDGFGNLAVTASTCDGTIPAGYVANSADCNDASSSIHPGAPETVGNGVDEDCNGSEICYVDGDSDTYGISSTIASSDVDCADPGEASNTLDCNDANAGVHPGAAEVCNGVDDDCDGTTDNGGAALCGDANPCTDDACNGVAGCGHVNNTGPCNDGSACTSPDACSGGTCGGTPISCDDGNVCTDDSCSPATGCSHANNTASCDDGALCTTSDTCSAGACAGSPVACDDGNVCTADACNPSTGQCDYIGGECVVEVDPSTDALDVSVGTNVTLTYHAPVDPASVTASTFRLLGPGNAPVLSTLAVSTDGTRATLDPGAALDADTIYRIETTAGILGPGSVPTAPFTGFFRTGAAAPTTEIPTVSEPTTPAPTQAQAGASVARCGDLNDDGIPDFCSGATGYTVNAPFARTAVVEAGAVLVYFGSVDSAERGQPDLIFEGVDPHDRVGVSIAGDFDFNGDGHPDIVIGAEQVDRTTDPENPTPTGNGKVYLIFFDPADTVHYPNIADPDVADVVSLSLVGQPGGVPGVVFEGEAFGDQAGFSVAGGGTSTATGGTDIVIGAPGADPGGRTDAGSVYVIFDSGTLSGDVSLADVSTGQPGELPGKEYQGAEAGDSLGYDTAFAGPTIEGASATTGSIIMSAPRASGGKGIVGVVSGDPDTTPIIVDAIGIGQPGFRIIGTQTDEGLGTAVDDGGDALADGTTDILIGAPGYDVGGDTDAGRVIQTSQVIPSGVYDADDVGTTIAGVIWTGEAAGDQLGTAVAGVGDVTGDGFDDIVLGAPFSDPVVGGVPQNDAGAVYVIGGSPVSGFLGTQSVSDVGTTIPGEVLTGTESGDHTGSSIAGTGDLSGDGHDDFTVGAPDADAAAGTVYMVLESTPPPVGQCGAAGCQVADLATGAELDVTAGALTGDAILVVSGLMTAPELPAPEPPGKLLYGAARFEPDGQPLLPPYGTIHLPTGETVTTLRAPNEVLPVYYFDGVGWSPAGFDATTETNPSYPTRIALTATASILRVYAVFVNDGDEDGIRDERDNCPSIANPSQLDTDDDGTGDACECLAVNCDDTNPCTDDACAPATGACGHAANAAACDDGDPCTANDACGGGSCQAGTPITAPPEASSLLVAANKTTLTWSAAPFATSYDAVRGLVSALAVGPGGGDETCFGGLAGNVLVDGSVPSGGTGYWYLVRGRNTCGAGTYGTQSNGTPRVTGTCP